MGKNAFLTWLGFATPEPAAEVDEQQPVTGGSEQMFTQTALKQHFSALRIQMKEVPKTSIIDPEAAQKVFASFKRIVDSAERLDANRLTKKDVDILKACLYQDLTKIVETAINRAYEKGWWHVINGYPDLGTMVYLTQVHSSLNSVLVRQQDPTYGRKMLALSAGATVQPIAGARSTFPHLDSISSEVDGALAVLRRSWEGMYAKDLMVDDRFLLDQIAISYLPDSWRLLESLSMSQPPVRRRALNMVLEQIHVLTMQVDEIIARESETTLRALEAQTDFIRTQRENKRSGSGRLSIEKAGA